LIITSVSVVQAVLKVASSCHKLWPRQNIVEGPRGAAALSVAFTGLDFFQRTADDLLQCEHACKGPTRAAKCLLFGLCVAVWTLSLYVPLHCCRYGEQSQPHLKLCSACVKFEKSKSAQATRKQRRFSIQWLNSASVAQQCWSGMRWVSMPHDKQAIMCK